jgi:hypothetical protein
MKIKYVQLESDAFLTDIDFVQFTPAERGVYYSLILLLTSNDGKCTFDPRALSRICNCDGVEEFENIWQRISKKFQLRKEQPRTLYFNEALSRIIPPASRSDRTCFRNVTNWLLEGCVSGRFNAVIFERVLDYAKQARQGKKPAAVFMAILKEELGYEGKGKS